MDILTILTVLGGIAFLAFVGFIVLSRLEFEDEANDKWNLMGMVTGCLLRQCLGTDCKITPYMMEQITVFARKMTPDEALPIGYAKFPKGIYAFFKKQPNIDKVFDKLCKCTSFTERRSFVRLLFRLVAEDDGLSNECWNVVVSFMYKMRLNQANYDYLLRSYAPLRKKGGDFSDYFASKDSASSTGETANAAFGAASQGAAATSANSLLKPYFDVLGLSISATKAEVQTAYRALALKHHPDLPKNASRQAECEEYMAKLNDAYAHLVAAL